jgi:rare lipoprotein A
VAQPPSIDPKLAVANGFHAIAGSFRTIDGATASAAVTSGFAVVEEADPTVAAVPDPEVLQAQAEIIRGGGRYRVGAPYEIAGKLYEPQEDPTYDRTGMASWYGASFHGRLTANGEIFDSTAISAAHPTMPLPSYVRITNLNNDRSIVVRVNDRGPYSGDRLIDVSEQTAALLGFRRRGLTQVRVEYMSRAPLAGEDKATLLATYAGPTAVSPNLLLASASPGFARLPTPDAVAFAPPPSPRPATAAMRTLTVSMPAAERILMAFRAAEEAEE